MPHRETKTQILKVAVLLCLVCSSLVSAAAVLLKPRQERNKDRERKKNILIAADGLFDPARHTDADVFPLYDKYIGPEGERIVDLAGTDWYADPPVENYDQRAATRDPALSDPVPPSKDLATIRRREKYSYVYLVEKEGRLDQVVLPIRGYGLWSTLWGFVSLDAESIRQGPEQIFVRGLAYYEHQETPGLGGEVDNPVWRARWKGKHIYDQNWNVVIEVVKSKTEPDHQVDALSGATITSNGVTNMMRYWFGEEGFQPFVKRLHEELSKGESLAAAASWALFPKPPATAGIRNDL